MNNITKKSDVIGRVISRRNFLRKVGKYSVVAATAMTGFMPGCDFLDKLTGKSGSNTDSTPTTTDNTPRTGEGTTIEKPYDININQNKLVTLNSNAPNYYFRINSSKASIHALLECKDFKKQSGAECSFCIYGLSLATHRLRITDSQTIYDMCKIDFDMNSSCIISFSNIGQKESQIDFEFKATEVDISSWNNSYSDFTGGWNNRWHNWYNSVDGSWQNIYGDFGA